MSRIDALAEPQARPTFRMPAMGRGTAQFSGSVELPVLATSAFWRVPTSPSDPTPSPTAVSRDVTLADDTPRVTLGRERTVRSRARPAALPM